MRERTTTCTDSWPATSPQVFQALQISPASRPVQQLRRLIHHWSRQTPDLKSASQAVTTSMLAARSPTVTPVATTTSHGSALSTSRLRAPRTPVRRARAAKRDRSLAYSRVQSMEELSGYGTRGEKGA